MLLFFPFSRLLFLLVLLPGFSRLRRVVVFEKRIYLLSFPKVFPPFVVPRFPGISVHQWPALLFPAIFLLLFFRGFFLFLSHNQFVPDPGIPFSLPPLMVSRHSI